MNKDNLYIVMPAYNESENIENIVQEWHSIIEKINNGSKLVIVDDSSKDDTYEKLIKLQKIYNKLEVLKKENSGHGISCLYLYNYSLEHNPNWIFQTDSDGQTNPNEFWIFWEKRNEYNFLIGSRLSRKDGNERIFVTKTLKFILFLIFRINIPDANTPFRLMRTDSLRNYVSIIPDNSFLSNILLSILIVNFDEKYAWLPISFKNRQGGVNSINFKKIIRIGFKAIKDFNNFKKYINEYKRN